MRLIIFFYLDSRLNSNKMAAKLAALVFASVTALLLLQPREATAVPETAKAAMKWKQCASGPITVHAVAVTPDPPRRGPFHLSLSATTGAAPVDGGTIQASVYYHGWHVYSTEGSLCGAVKQQTSSAGCPLPPRTAFTINTVESMPSLAPPGPYNLRLRALSADGKRTQLMCVDFSFTV